jgi:hypothetical protein
VIDEGRRILPEAVRLEPLPQTRHDFAAPRRRRDAWTRSRRGPVSRGRSLSPAVVFSLSFQCTSW